MSSRSSAARGARWRLKIQTPRVTRRAQGKPSRNLKWRKKLEMAYLKWKSSQSQRRRRRTSIRWLRITRKGRRPLRKRGAKRQSANSARRRRCSGSATTRRSPSPLYRLTTAKQPVSSTRTAMLPRRLRRPRGRSRRSRRSLTRTSSRWRRVSKAQERRPRSRVRGALHSENSQRGNDHHVLIALPSHYPPSVLEKPMASGGLVIPPLHQILAER